MENNQKIAEVLNDLIEINNDRVEGYKKAISMLESDDTDLINVYNNMASQSQQYVSDLTQEVRKMGEKPSDDSTTRGKIYRAWMSVKNTFTYDDRQTTLNECEYGEDNALKAYDEALKTNVEMTVDLRRMLATQRSELKVSHDQIKRQRDYEKAVH